MNKKYTVSILFLIAALFISMSLDLKSEKKVLRWAADNEGSAPFINQDYDDATKLIGFEKEIADALAEELGWESQFVYNSWDGLIPGLSRDDYDIAINGLEITEDRAAVVTFSDPYFLTYEQLVVPVSDTSTKCLNDVFGKKCGTLKGSVAERFLIATPGAIVKSYDNELTAFQEMQMGRLDAVLIDHPIALYFCSWNKKAKMVGLPIGEVSYGIVLRKTDTKLIADINRALAAIVKNGKLRIILERWNLWNYMLVSHFDDPNPSSVGHPAFKRFVESKGGGKSFGETVQRYIGYLPAFGQGAVVTVTLSILSMMLAIFAGLSLALMRVYGNRVISRAAIIFIETVRGTPLLIQIMIIYYALPMIGLQMPAFFAGVIGLGLNYAAYEAENYRAGLFSVPRGQIEAAMSLGMSKFQSLRHIILPQAIRLVIPPVTNDYISLLKDSSLVSLIAITELTKVFLSFAARDFDFLGPGLMVAVIYLLIGLPFVKLAKIIEKRFSIDHRKTV
ncbi:MAG: ABC transporter substrate-binding protein/permease [Candidatus Kapabacteria bacterium]|jgi:polar amino acid transport system substrate-binding protein|nr:ABC transporter substrate-binding protein/permease [Candidatus Kapabacteria bacterium]